jgi:two-component system alkaline phosphatase synthesis response regulator PhoP
MKKKILIIDDEKDFCYFIKENLQLFGDNEVITTTSGKKGLQAASKEKPDLILLDIMMPGMDGFEVLKRLKRDMKTIHIPVIMLTAKNEEKAKMEAAGLYSVDYLVKPVETNVLKSKIDQVLAITKLP